IPGLRIFGYTANLPGARDAREREIGEAIGAMNAAFPDRCVIRFSAPRPVPMGAVVIDADPRRPDVVVCPAETEKTMGCGTCGLCWAPKMRGKTIAFLRHGMKRNDGPRGPRKPAAGGARRARRREDTALTPAQARVLAAIRARADDASEA